MAVLLALLAGVLVGCGGGDGDGNGDSDGDNNHANAQPTASPDADSADDQALQTEQAEQTAAPSPELADMMGHVQRYAQKLGYAIEARDQPLAQFYAGEVAQSFDRMRAQAPEYEGIRVAYNIDLMMNTTVNNLNETLETTDSAPDWQTVENNYSSLITSCNTCHEVTQRPFIEITNVLTDPPGHTPYNQNFGLDAGDADSNASN